MVMETVFPATPATRLLTTCESRRQVRDRVHEKEGGRGVEGAANKFRAECAREEILARPVKLAGRNML